MSAGACMLLPALLLTPCAPPTWALLQINQAHLPRACGRRAWRCRRPPPRAARPRPAASRGRPRRRPPPPPAPPAPEPRSAPRRRPPPRRAGPGRARARAPAPRRARAARPWPRARAGPARRARRCGCGCARSRARRSASAAAPARPPPRAMPPACRRAPPAQFGPASKAPGCQVLMLHGKQRWTGGHIKTPPSRQASEARCRNEPISEGTRGKALCQSLSSCKASERASFAST